MYVFGILAELNPELRPCWEWRVIISLLCSLGALVVRVGLGESYTIIIWEHYYRPNIVIV